MESSSKLYQMDSNCVIETRKCFFRCPQSGLDRNSTQLEKCPEEVPDLQCLKSLCSILVLQCVVWLQERDLLTRQVGLFFKKFHICFRCFIRYKKNKEQSYVFFFFLGWFRLILRAHYKEDRELITSDFICRVPMYSEVRPFSSVLRRPFPYWVTRKSGCLSVQARSRKVPTVKVGE